MEKIMSTKVERDIFEIKKPAVRGILGFLTLFTIMILVLTGCYKNDSEYPTEEKEEVLFYDMPIALSEKNEASAEIKQVMDIYKDCDEDSFSEIQKRISEIGFPVSLPGVYTDMSNYMKFEDYLEKCEHGKSCSITLYRIHEDGGLSRNKYIFDGNSMYLMVHKAGWNENELQIYYSNYSRIVRWDYSKNGWFSYELYVCDSPEITEVINGCEMIRVKPFDKTLKKWSEEIAYPIGYHGINIMSSDWDLEHFENINFDACFEYFYYMKYKDKVDMDDIEDGIPEKMYEEVIGTYLPIDKHTLRKYVQFDKKKKVYYYSRIGYMNASPAEFETSIPEVINIVDLEDNVYQLRINAVCGMQYPCDQILTHDLTVKKVENGPCQYISNRIIQ
jgi:phosphoribosyl-AMP cyclohydrolase